MNGNHLHSYIDPELEARIVALVSGEASDFEREELERLMAESPELAIFRKRIETMHRLLKEVARGELDESKEEWKLSEERRKRVLDIIDGAPAESDPAVVTAAIRQSKRAGGDVPWIRVAAMAAAVLVACVVGAALFLPGMESVRPASVARVESLKNSYDWDASGSADRSVWFDVPKPDYSRQSIDGGDQLHTVNESNFATDLSVKFDDVAARSVSSLSAITETLNMPALAQASGGENAEPGVVEFDGFVNYGDAIKTTESALREEGANLRGSSDVTRFGRKRSETPGRSNSALTGVADRLEEVEPQSLDSLATTLSEVDAVAGAQRGRDLRERVRMPAIAEGEPGERVRDMSVADATVPQSRGQIAGDESELMDGVEDSISVGYDSKHEFRGPIIAGTAGSVLGMESEELGALEAKEREGGSTIEAAPRPAPAPVKKMSGNLAGGAGLGGGGGAEAKVLRRSKRVAPQDKELSDLAVLAKVPIVGQMFDHPEPSLEKGRPAPAAPAPAAGMVVVAPAQAPFAAPAPAPGQTEVFSRDGLQRRDLGRTTSLSTSVAPVESKPDVVRGFDSNGTLLGVEDGESAAIATAGKVTVDSPAPVEDVPSDSFSTMSGEKTSEAIAKEPEELARHFGAIVPKAPEAVKLQVREAFGAMTDKRTSGSQLAAKADAFAWSGSRSGNSEIEPAAIRLAREDSEMEDAQSTGGRAIAVGGELAAAKQKAAAVDPFTAPEPFSKEESSRRGITLKQSADSGTADQAATEATKVPGASGGMEQTSEAKDYNASQSADGEARAGFFQRLAEQWKSQAPGATEFGEVVSTESQVAEKKLAQITQSDAPEAEVGLHRAEYTEQARNDADWEKNLEELDYRFDNIDATNSGSPAVAGKPAATTRIAPPAGLDETNASEEAFSTFSLHVSDVSFKLAQAALAKGEWPEAARIRIEEFVNAFDYGDPMPGERDKVACRLEQSTQPFLQQRNLLRVSMRTAAAGRSGSTPLRLTFLLDNSGSMERVDRQETVRRAFAQLANQLQPIDQVTLISFARQPRLVADRVGGERSRELIDFVANLPSEGGTNLEAALQLAFEKAREQQVDNAQNRIILLTDGAANLGDAEPESLSRTIETMRDSGIAFDAAGIGADGLNDEILEALTRKGDGRYYLLDRPEDADDGFARQIVGALRPAAKNVKVQVEFNPKRVGRYKLLGFEKHRLEKEDFRNDSVDAAEMAAEEAGVAVYQFEPLPGGEGDVGSVSVRFRDMSSGEMVEKLWPIPHEPAAPRPGQAAPSMRLATAASLFAAKLKGGSLGETVDLGELRNLLTGLPPRYANVERVQQLREMIDQARELSGE